MLIFIVICLFNKYHSNTKFTVYKNLSNFAETSILQLYVFIIVIFFYSSKRFTTCCENLKKLMNLLLFPNQIGK